MDNCLKNLNELAAKYLSNFEKSNLQSIYINNITSDVNGTTITRDPDSVFNLKPPVGGFLKQYTLTDGKTFDNPQDVTVVYRGVIGYCQAYKYLKDETLFVYDMMHQINIGLQSLKFNLGKDFERFSITIEQPDQIYFTNLENAAAYEFRLVAKIKVL